MTVTANFIALNALYTAAGKLHVNVMSLNELFTQLTRSVDRTYVARVLFKVSRITTLSCARFYMSIKHGYHLVTGGPIIVACDATHGE